MHMIKGSNTVTVVYHNNNNNSISPKVVRKKNQEELFYIGHAGNSRGGIECLITSKKYYKNPTPIIRLPY